MSYKIVKDILPSNCIKQIKLLLTELDFILAREDTYQHMFFDPNYVFAGFSRVTTDTDHMSPSNKLLYTRLNDYGFMITELICKKANIDLKKIKRFMWNLYRKGDEGTKHTDEEDDSYFTILFSLNTSDGYLEVDNEKIYDVENEAKIFKSNLLHRGVGPINTNYRLNLNIVIQV
jgi:hypothetical protein